MNEDASAQRKSSFVALPKNSLSIEPSRLMLGARTSRPHSVRQHAQILQRKSVCNQIRAARSVRTRTSALPATGGLFQMPTTFWAKLSRVDLRNCERSGAGVSNSQRGLEAGVNEAMKDLVNALGRIRHTRIEPPFQHRKEFARQIIRQDRNWNQGLIALFLRAASI